MRAYWLVYRSLTRGFRDANVAPTALTAYKLNQHGQEIPLSPIEEAEAHEPF
jgi:hypothetical protein